MLRRTTNSIYDAVVEAFRGAVPLFGATVIDQRATMTATSQRSSAVHPIIPGFFPDPSICRVGEDYFVANSSFEYSPAVPLWRSADLVTWTQAGHALDGGPQFPAGRARMGSGIYAPTLRHHDGRFWMITTDVSGGKGQLVTTATDIGGPWTPAVRIDGILGIDPDIAWTDDGTCLITFSSNDERAPGIAQVRVDIDAGTVLEGPYTVYAGTGAAYPEGPHLFRRGAWWYLLYAEGGTERGHCVSIARASDPRGPYEGCAANPLLTRRSTVFPIQNTGHADMVQRPDGSWAMVYLGVRARGATPLYHANGRETLLAGVEWSDDGWPRVLPDAFDVPPVATDFDDDFAAADLDVRWVSPGCAPRDFATPGGGASGRGVMVLPSVTDAGVASILGVRTRDLRWVFEASSADRDGAAVHLRMDDRHWCELSTTPTGVRLDVAIGPIRQGFVDETPLSDTATLRVRALDDSWGGPDDLEFSVTDAAGTRVLARLDGRYWTTEVCGLFAGRVIGVRALREAVRFERVSYASLPDERSGS